MKFSYDSRFNIAYIRFTEKKCDVNTISVNDELNIDLLPDGTVYGIELLNANKQLRDFETEIIIFFNEGNGIQISKGIIFNAIKI